MSHPQKQNTNFHKKRRSRIQIVMDILNVVSERQGQHNKTDIMQIALVSPTQLNHFISIMIKEELISYNEKTKKFSTTKRGLRILKKYKKLSEFTSDSLI